MAAKYWIKLYHEILHDRKMATLDDRIWRRIIECFLMAGEEDNGGYMPPLVDIAWMLRVDEEQLETEYNELVRLRILEFKDGLYFVRKFVDRQQPLPKAEYMRRKRNEEQLLEYYQPVTNGNADKIQIRIDTEPDSAAVFKAYEQNIGALTPHVAEKINSNLQDIPPEWIIKAIQVAVENNARRWAYISAILDRWRTEGIDAGRPSKDKKPSLIEGLKYAGTEPNPS